MDLWIYSKRVSFNKINVQSKQLFGRRYVMSMQKKNKEQVLRL